MIITWADPGLWHRIELKQRDIKGKPTAAGRITAESTLGEDDEAEPIP